MKAFHHSGTNLISVWKSGPRTVVLSEKSQMTLYLPFQLQFHIIALTFLLILSLLSDFLLDFFFSSRCYLHFATLPVNPHESILSNETPPITLTQSFTAQQIPSEEDCWKGQLYLILSYFIFSFHKIRFFSFFFLVCQQPLQYCLYCITHHCSLLQTLQG